MQPLVLRRHRGTARIRRCPNRQSVCRFRKELERGHGQHQPKRALVNEQNSRATPKSKTPMKGKSKPENPSTEHVSLDNADTVINGPSFARFAKGGCHGRRPTRFATGGPASRCAVSHLKIACPTLHAFRSVGTTGPRGRVFSERDDTRTPSSARVPNLRTSRSVGHPPDISCASDKGGCHGIAKALLACYSRGAF
jgi:hypothetical protein